MVGVEEGGCTTGCSDPYIQGTREAKKALRKEQRREAASLRNQKVEHIMNAENNTKTFFKLIKEQRKSSATQTESRIIGDKRCNTDHEICECWSEHFQNLATLLQNNRFDSQYKEQVNDDIDCLKSICQKEAKQIRAIQAEEVQKALRKLKNNKAADAMGLTSEHLKLAGQPLVQFLTDSLNHLIQTRRVSVVLKERIVTPIYKKGDPTLPGNYRRITVTPVLLKVQEHILNIRHNKILDPTQSSLQRGLPKAALP